MMWQRLIAGLLLLLMLPACTRDAVRCDTHKVSNGELTECREETAAMPIRSTSPKRPA